MYGALHGSRISPLWAAEDILLSIHASLARFPESELLYTPAGLAPVAPPGCQMTILCELVERAEQLAARQSWFPASEARGLRTSVEFLLNRLGRLDTSYITCPDCNLRLWRIQRSLNAFSAHLNHCPFSWAVVSSPYLVPWPAAKAEDQECCVVNWVVEDPEPPSVQIPARQELSSDWRSFIVDGAEWPQELCANFVSFNVPTATAPARRMFGRRIGRKPPEHWRDRPRIRGPDPMRQTACTPRPRFHPGRFPYFSELEKRPIHCSECDACVAQRSAR